MVAPMLPAIGKNILESGLSSLTRNTWYRSTWYRKHLATKHLETKQTALAPASCPHDALVSYRLFPNSEIRWPHSPSVSLRAIVRPPPQSQFCDPRMLPAPHTAEQQGCLRAHCDSDRFSTARERRCAKHRLGANGGYDQRPLAPPSRTLRLERDTVTVGARRDRPKHLQRGCSGLRGENNLNCLWWLKFGGRRNTASIRCAAAHTPKGPPCSGTGLPNDDGSAVTRRAPNSGNCRPRA